MAHGAAPPGAAPPEAAPPEAASPAAAPEEALAALIAAGPPKEEVGLDSAPYALDPRLSEHLNPRPEPLEIPAERLPTDTTEFLGTTIPVGVPR